MRKFINALQTISFILVAPIVMIAGRYTFTFYGWLASKLGITVFADVQIFKVFGVLVTTLCVAIILGVFFADEEGEENEK